MSLRPLLGALLAVLALGVAACGGNDAEVSNAYVDKVNAAQQRFAKSVGQIDTSAQDPAALERNLGRLSGEVQRTADAIAGAKPPAKVRTANGRLVDILAAYSAELEDLSGRIGEGSVSRQLAAAEKIVTATTSAQKRFNTAIEAINTQLREA